MLTLTDVHLLVGMLSLITNPESVEVELGSRVLDAASGTNATSTSLSRRGIRTAR
jgi:hypothetical protein